VVEQLIRNQQVVRSTRIAGSIYFTFQQNQANNFSKNILIRFLLIMQRQKDKG
jgi:hypothetical protein